ncbi:MAG: hypothetical protein QW046_03955 [Candidatus Micrarchaeaceae archaeon]
MLSGVGFSIGLPRVVDNVGDLFKTTNNVKVSGVVKSLDKTKIDLDNIQTKVGGSLKNLKLDKTNIDVARVSEVLGKIRDLNNLPSIEGVLRDIENNIRDMAERLNGVVKIDAEVKVGLKGPEAYITRLALRGEDIASLTAEIERIQQAADVTIEKLNPAIKITKEGTVKIEGGGNSASIIAKMSNEGKVDLYENLPNNTFYKLEVPSKGLPTSKTVEISNGNVHGTTLSPDILNLERANPNEINPEKAVNEFSQIPEEISRLEAQFENKETTAIPISKDFANYLQAKLDALRSQTEQITSTMEEIHQNNPDFEAAEEEIARLGLTDQLKSTEDQLKTLYQKLSALRQISGLLKTATEKAKIDIEPLLKDYIDGKISDTSALVKALGEKLYDYYKPQIDSLENDILNDLQKKGATPDQIAEIKDKIDKLASMRLTGFRKLSNPIDVADVIELTNDYINDLHEIEALAKNASNANDIIDTIKNRLGGGSGTQYEIQANTKEENQPLGSNNISQPKTPQNTPNTTGQTPGTATSGGVEIKTGSGQSLIAVPRSEEAVKSAESNVLNLSLKYRLSDIINTARQILGEDFDKELYAFSKLFGKDSVEQAILDAVKKSPTPDLDTIARTLGDVIKSKVDEALRDSPDKAVATIEDMLKINNDLVKSKLTTDLLNFIKNNPKATFNDLLAFTEKDLPKIVNDVKDTLANSVLDQLSKGLGDLTNVIGKDSLKTFLENEIKNGVFDVNKLLNDARAFVDSRLTELLKANPEQVVSTILDSAKIGNKLIRDKLLADTLDFVKRFGGNVTLKDIAEFIAKDAADLKTQLTSALKSGNVKELANTLPALKNVLDEIKKDPVRGLRQYFSLIDPTLADALNKITPDNALDILNALKSDNLTKISQITGLSVDELERPEVKFSIISVVLDDLMKKLKAKQITDTEFESAIESLKEIIDEILPEYRSLLGDYAERLQDEVQEVQNYAKQKRLPKIVELYDTLVPSAAALPVIFSIASNNDISYLLDYAEQLASEEQTPQVSQQIPQQGVQEEQQGTTVLSTPAEPESPILGGPLPPPPSIPNNQNPPNYQPQMGPNAPALAPGNRNTRYASGETQEQVLYFPIS